MPKCCTFASQDLNFISLSFDNFHPSSLKCARYLALQKHQPKLSSFSSFVFDVCLQTPQGTIKAIIVKYPSTTIQQKDSTVMVCGLFRWRSFLFYFFSLYQFLAGWQIGSFPVIRWRWLCNLSWKCTKGPTSFKKEDQLLSPAFSPEGVLLGFSMKNLRHGCDCT